jgi:hypothetical protein
MQKALGMPCHLLISLLANAVANAVRPKDPLIIDMNNTISHLK